MSSKVCPHCKAPNRYEAKFCVQCGRDITQYDPTTQATAQPSTDQAESNGASLLDKVMGTMDKLAGEAEKLLDAHRTTRPVTEQGKPARAQPDRLASGCLYPTTVYRRVGTAGSHAAYFVANSEQDTNQYFLIRQVTAFPCDANVAHKLVALSKELQSVQGLVDVICMPDGHTYLVLEHPKAEEGWHFLSDPHDPFPPERVIEWGQQIGLTLASLHRSGYTLGEKQQAGLEKILIDGNSAKLADLSQCVPLPSDEAQKRQAILNDLFFLARMLYWAATGQNLSRDWANLKIDGLPRSLRVAITSGARGSYVSIHEMLTNLAGKNLPPLRLAAGKATHPGRMRDHNEDQYFVYEISKGRSDQPLPAFYMVADGMGGHESGEVASDTISAALKAWLDEFSSRKSGRATQKLGETPEEAIKTAIQEANVAVFQQARKRQSDMGATVTAALVVGEQAFVANVGDSRTYLFRRGKLDQVTRDHSVVFSLMAAGQIQRDEIYTHPQRNQIYRSLGEKANVEVDVFPRDLEPGDILILCSDGLWEMVRDSQIAEIVRSARNPQEACDRLVEAANRNGGEDNITVIVVRVE